MKRKVLGGDGLSPAEDHCALNKVLQFSDISGIRITKKKGSCLFRDIRN